MPLDLTTLPPTAVLTSLYIGYFGRAADPEGMAFWRDALTQDTLSLTEIAADFATQPEALDTYAFLLDPRPELANSFVTQVYTNLFNRPPDVPGLSFWSGIVQDAVSGASDLRLGDVIPQIISGAQNSVAGNDLSTIQNKIEAGVFWTESAELAQVDYLNDVTVQESARSTIANVTDDPETVPGGIIPVGPFFEQPKPQPNADGPLDTHGALVADVGLIGQTASVSDTDFSI